MRHRSRAIIPALALISALAPAAYADDHIEYVGFTCGFASSNDPTGLVEQDPNVQTGEMDGGPWTASDLFDDAGMPGTLELAQLNITCSIQVNQADYGGSTAAQASCHSTGTGFVYVVCTISYTALPTDNVYLCTKVAMTTSAGSQTYVFDEDDNEANGNQCSLAISAGA